MNNVNLANVALPEVSMDSFVSLETGKPFMQLVEEQPDVRAYRAGLFLGDAAELMSMEASALRAVAESSRACMTYDENSRPWDNQETGSCYSYTWTIAEAASSLGFTSLISFCNDHAFNLVLGENKSVHVINGESRKMWFLNAHMHSATERELRPEVVAKISQEVEEEGVSYLGLRTDDIKFHYQQERDKSKSKPQYDVPWLEAMRPAAAFMRMDLGQLGLYSYDKYTEALRGRDIEQTEHFLGALAIINPQAETRPKINTYLTAFGRRVKQWDQEGQDTERLVSLIHSLKDVMPETVGMQTLAADWLRGLGKRRRSARLVEMADKHYEKAQAVSLKPANPTLEGKRRTTKDLLADLLSTEE